MPFDWRTQQLMHPYECLIYLHGSTCDRDIGLTLTLAHELQHFIQYPTCRPIWAAGVLLSNLPNLNQEHFVRPADYPIERNARVVAKRTAISLYGTEAVSDYIRDRIRENLTPIDVVDWRFMLSDEADEVYDMDEGTRLLVERHRNALIEEQSKPQWEKFPEVTDLNLSEV